TTGGSSTSSDRLTIWKTTDGGSSWTETTPAGLTADDANWGTVADSHNSAIGDTLWFGTRTGRILKTTDRGDTWNIYDTGIEDGAITSIEFQDELYGIATTALSTAGFEGVAKGARTRDGGLTWSPINTPEFKAMSLKYVPGTKSTYIYTDGWYTKNMAITTDFGSTWKNFKNPDGIVCTDFYSPTEGWAGGDIKSGGKGGFYKFTSSFASDQVNVKTLAGNQVEGVKLGNPLRANLYNPKGMDIDSSGNIYIANDYGCNILKLTPAGKLELVAGSEDGLCGDVNGVGDSVRLNRPQDVALAANGDLYVADGNNLKIRKITFTEGTTTVSTYAGTGESGMEDGNLTSATFSFVTGLVFDSQNNLFVTDDTAIRKITPAGEVTTFAGSASPGNADGVGNAATFGLIWGVDIDQEDNIYVTDLINHSVRKITSAGEVTTIAGSGFGYADGTGIAARFAFPEGIAVNPEGEIFVADGINGFIRKIDTAGMVTTVAGTLSANRFSEPFGPDEQIVDGTGDYATFTRSAGLLLRPNGNLIHSAWSSDMLRELEFGVPSSQITVSKGIIRPNTITHIDHQDGFKFFGEVNNVSEEDAAQIVMQVQVSQNGSPVFIEQSGSIDLPVGEADAFEIESRFIPEAAATYTVRFRFLQDELVQFTLYDEIVVSDSIMADHDDNFYFSDDYSRFFDNFENSYGVAYQLAVADTITGIYFPYAASEAGIVEYSILLLNDDETTRSIYRSEPDTVAPTSFERSIHAIEPLFVPAGKYLFTIQGSMPLTILNDNNKVSDDQYIIEPEENRWVRFSSLTGFEAWAIIANPILGSIPTVVSKVDKFSELVKMKVSPNPFTAAVQVELETPQRGFIRLLDANGKLLKMQALNGKQTEINGLNALPAGGYLLMVEGENVRTARRIIKK
ncbi:MAG: T9SS type A sorting domain-containing protein, partial [Saprospiraceae bacterium]